jgi:hypothetical protein
MASFAFIRARPPLRSVGLRPMPWRALGRAGSRGKRRGVVSVDGTMVDAPVRHEQVKF